MGKTIVDTTSVVNASSETNTFTPETAEPVSAFDYNEMDIVPVSRADTGTFLPQGLTETNPSLLQSIPQVNAENKRNGERICGAECSKKSGDIREAK